MIGGVFTILSTGLSLYDAQQATGFFGWDQVALNMGKLVSKMEFHAYRHDHDALDEMVALARSRVPVDTGRLYNGINGDAVDDEYIFSASAVHEDRSSGADYARFVEFGTSGGTVGVSRVVVADAGFYSGASGPAARRRISYRTHEGTDPRPFFYNSAHEVLAERDQRMADVISDSASESDWELLS